MKYLIRDPESCFLNLLADSLGDPNSAGFRGVRQQDDKLLAAIPGGQILRPGDVPFDAVGDHFQAVIAHQMAVGIVKALEVINIYHQQRQRLLKPIGMDHVSLKLFVKVPPVFESGKGIRRTQFQ